MSRARSQAPQTQQQLLQQQQQQQQQLAAPYTGEWTLHQAVLKVATNIWARVEAGTDEVLSHGPKAPVVEAANAALLDVEAALHELTGAIPDVRLVTSLENLPRDAVSAHELFQELMSIVAAAPDAARGKTLVRIVESNFLGVVQRAHVDAEKQIRLLTGKLQRRGAVIGYLQRTLHHEIITLQEQLLSLLHGASSAVELKQRKDAGTLLFSLVDFLELAEHHDPDSPEGRRLIEAMLRGNTPGAAAPPDDALTSELRRNIFQLEGELKMRSRHLANVLNQHGQKTKQQQTRVSELEKSLDARVKQCTQLETALAAKQKQLEEAWDQHASELAKNQTELIAAVQTGAERGGRAAGERARVDLERRRLLAYIHLLASRGLLDEETFLAEVGDDPSVIEELRETNRTRAANEDIAELNERLRAAKAERDVAASKAALCTDLEAGIMAYFRSSGEEVPPALLDALPKLRELPRRQHRCADLEAAEEKAATEKVLTMQLATGLTQLPQALVTTFEEAINLLSSVAPEIAPVEMDVSRRRGSVEARRQSLFPPATTNPGAELRRLSSNASFRRSASGRDGSPFVPPPRDGSVSPGASSPTPGRPAAPPVSSLGPTGSAAQQSAAPLPSERGAAFVDAASREAVGVAQAFTASVTAMFRQLKKTGEDKVAFLGRDGADAFGRIRELSNALSEREAELRAARADVEQAEERCMTVERRLIEYRRLAQERPERSGTAESSPSSSSGDAGLDGSETRAGARRARRKGGMVAPTSHVSTQTTTDLLASDLRPVTPGRRRGNASPRGATPPRTPAGDAPTSGGRVGSTPAAARSGATSRAGRSATTGGKPPRGRSSAKPSAGGAKGGRAATRGSSGPDSSRHASSTNAGSPPPESLVISSSHGAAAVGPATPLDPSRRPPPPFTTTVSVPPTVPAPRAAGASAPVVVGASHTGNSVAASVVRGQPAVATGGAASQQMPPPATATTTTELVSSYSGSVTHSNAPWGLSPSTELPDSTMAPGTGAMSGSTTLTASMVRTVEVGTSPIDFGLAPPPAEPPTRSSGQGAGTAGTRRVVRAPRADPSIISPSSAVSPHSVSPERRSDGSRDGEQPDRKLHQHRLAESIDEPPTRLTGTGVFSPSEMLLNNSASHVLHGADAAPPRPDGQSGAKPGTSTAPSGSGRRQPALADGGPRESVPNSGGLGVVRPLAGAPTVSSAVPRDVHYDVELQDDAVQTEAPPCTTNRACQTDSVEPERVNVYHTARGVQLMNGWTQVSAPHATSVAVQCETSGWGLDELPGWTAPRRREAPMGLMRGVARAAATAVDGQSHALRLAARQQHDPDLLPTLVLQRQHLDRVAVGDADAIPSALGPVALPLGGSRALNASANTPDAAQRMPSREIGMGIGGRRMNNIAGASATGARAGLFAATPEPQSRVEARGIKKVLRGTEDALVTERVIVERFMNRFGAPPPS